MKIMDLFCGTGGFSKGFEQSEKMDFQTVLGVDLLPHAVETFQRNHLNGLGLCRDIRKISKPEIASRLGIKRGEVAAVIGGPPCQGFSSIRPFRSSRDDDPRNSLFEMYASFVNYFRPGCFVMENVAGIATHRNGYYTEMMQECFHGIGYESDWRLLNAAHFGVPQKRERFIMIGVERGADIVFPKPTHQYNGPTIGYRDKSRVISSPEKETEIHPLPKAISVMDAIDDLPPVKSGESSDSYTAPPRTNYQKERRRRAHALTHHIATKHSGKMLRIIRHSGKNIDSIPKDLISSGFSSCYSRLNGNEPATTITVNFVHPASNRCIHPALDRALTPREGARLQSFDDDFEFFGNRTQVIKQIGNAVPPLLGKAIADTLADHIL